MYPQRRFNPRLYGDIDELEPLMQQAPQLSQLPPMPTSQDAPLSAKLSHLGQAMDRMRGTPEGGAMGHEAAGMLQGARKSPFDRLKRMLGRVF